MEDTIRVGEKHEEPSIQLPVAGSGENIKQENKVWISAYERKNFLATEQANECFLAVSNMQGGFCQEGSLSTALVSNGCVDFRGRIADKSTTGGWKASPFIIGIQYLTTHYVFLQELNYVFHF